MSTDIDSQDVNNVDSIDSTELAPTANNETILNDEILDQNTNLNGDSQTQTPVQSDTENDETKKTTTLIISEETETNVDANYADNLNLLLNDVNYCVILAFWEKFREHLQLQEYPFNNLDSHLLNKKSINKKLFDYQLNLLKKLSYGKFVKKEKWEYYMKKATSKYSQDDAAKLETNGYLECDVSTKVRILKNLLESQFDENQKLKEKLPEIELSTMRSTPIGRDKDGRMYWFFMDKDYSVRVFNQMPNDADATSWQILAKDLKEFKELHEKLRTDPCMEKYKVEEPVVKVEDLVKPESQKMEVDDEEITRTEVKSEKAEQVDVLLKPDVEQTVKSEEQVVKEETPVVTEDVKPDINDFSHIEDTDAVIPIALRKSRRSTTLKKQQEAEVVKKPEPAKTPAKPKTPKKPAKSKKQDEDNDDTPQTPVSLKKKKNDDSDDDDDPTRCMQCKKVKARQLVLLCDGCDDAYHLTCLNPPIQDVPDGDWFCPLCEHNKLCKILTEKLDVIDEHYRQLEIQKNKSLQQRTNRIANIGANLDNLFHKKPKTTTTKPRVKRSYYDSVTELNGFNGNDMQILGTRSCRLKSRINYTFEEYDRTINEAIDENGDEVMDDGNADREDKRVCGRRRSGRRRNSNDSDRSFSSVEGRVKSSRKRDSDLDETDEEDAVESDVSFGSDDSVAKKVIPFRPRSTRPKRKRRFLGEDSDDDEGNQDDDDEDGVEDEADDDEIGYDDEDDDDEEDYGGRAIDRPKRDRKAVQRSYCEISDEENDNEIGDNRLMSHRNLSNMKQKKKKKKYSDDDSYRSDEVDDDAKPPTNKAKTKKIRRNSFDSQSDDNESDDDSAKKPAKKPVIHKPWDSDEEEDDEDVDDDDEEEEDSENQENSHPNGNRLTNKKDLNIYIKGDEAIVELDQNDDSIDFMNNIAPPKLGLANLGGSLLNQD